MGIHPYCKVLAFRNLRNGCMECSCIYPYIVIAHAALPQKFHDAIYKKLFQQPSRNL